jgi:hypothetical protein
MSTVLGSSDLKGLIKESGLNNNCLNETVPGDPNDEMYLRQAGHLMRRGAYQTAIVYLHESLTMNPESKVTFCNNYMSVPTSS